MGSNDNELRPSDTIYQDCVKLIDSPILQKAIMNGFTSLSEKQNKETDDYSDAMNTEKPFQELF